MSGQAFAILLAGSFTFGCAAIHAWREHAAALTPPLAAALVCLTVLVGLVSLAGPVTDRRDDSPAASQPHR